MAHGIIDTSFLRKSQRRQLKLKLTALKLKSLVRPLSAEDEKLRQECLEKLHWLDKIDSGWIKF